MKCFLFKKVKLSRQDKNNPLCYALASRTRIPYLLNCLPKTGHVLDLGCGIGFLSNLIAQKLSKVIALDPDKQSLDKARDFYKKNKIKFIQAPAEKIPLPADSIDFLVCSEVLEHVDNLEKTLKEAKRVCKDGSKFFITVPSIDGIFGNFFLKIGHAASNRYERHQRPPFTKKNIIKILLNYGFRVEKVYYSNIFLAEICIGIIKLSHRLIKGRPMTGQADIISPPKIYQKIFPLILFLANLEDFVLNNALRGHMIIITGQIKK